MMLKRLSYIVNLRLKLDAESFRSGALSCHSFYENIRQSSPIIEQPADYTRLCPPS